VTPAGEGWAVRVSSAIIIEARREGELGSEGKRNRWGQQRRGVKAWGVRSVQEWRLSARDITWSGEETGTGSSSEIERQTLRLAGIFPEAATRAYLTVTHVF
jgi:hypothetical protein